LQSIAPPAEDEEEKQEEKQEKPEEKEEEEAPRLPVSKGGWRPSRPLQSIAPPAEDDDEDDNTPMQSGENSVAGGEADSATGITSYSVARLKSMARLPGSEGSCPANIPPEIRADGVDISMEDSSKRYKMQFLEQFKQKPACQEMPENHRIPRDLQAGGEPSTPKGGRPKDLGPMSPTGDGADDWRRDSVRYQSKAQGKGDKSGRNGDRSVRSNAGGRTFGRGFDEPQPKLEKSESSWSAKQSDAKVDNDAAVSRAMKSILNKLTVEKFDALYIKLLEAGIEKKEHIETLMREVFEKATTQHHFIEMYTQLCRRFNDWLSERNICEEGEAVSFKRILLNQCQDSFEKYLKPPEGIEALSGEDREEARHAYRTKMLGNMKFVGQLLINKMLSSKVILQCTEELLHWQSEETLETLCVFLQTIGPAFDSHEWKSRGALTGVFHRLSQLVSDKKVTARIKCLIKDVIELRAAGWDKRGKPSGQPEGPKALSEVKSQWVKDNEKSDGNRRTPAGGGRPPVQDDEWGVVASKRGAGGVSRFAGNSY